MKNHFLLCFNFSTANTLIVNFPIIYFQIVNFPIEPPDHKMALTRENRQKYSSNAKSETSIKSTDVKLNN